VPATERKQWVAISLQLLDLARPGDPSDVRTWPHWNLLRPHVAFAVAQADREGITAPTSKLMSELGVLLHAKALSAEAEPLMWRALALDESSFGADHPNVAIDLNNLAQLLQATNPLAEAELLMRRALAIDESSVGADHPDVGILLNSLAQLLQDTNRLAEAEPLMRRAVIAILNFTRNTGHEHSHLNLVLENYAGLLAEMALPEEEVQSRLSSLS
jgi:tetratricopeptide (TPR) repeat protein